MSSIQYGVTSKIFKNSISLRGALTGFVGEFEQPELVRNFKILQASKIPRNKGKAVQKWQNL
jgi:hypothetical protein